jgi:AcrR family transcriptional regulator
MTEKQQKILVVALQMFAKDGYAASSTNSVAKAAGVSEALIFRHFGNKAGLLEAVVRMGKERAKDLYADIVLESEPIALLRKTLEMPLKILDDPQIIAFWKLQYRIKWEMEEYRIHKMEPLKLMLSDAFSKLGYAEPEREAMHVLIMIDGLAMRFLLLKDFDLEPQIRFMQRKYQI